MSPATIVRLIRDVSMSEPDKYRIPWDPQLNTGIGFIDKQHQRFLEHFQELLNAVAEQRETPKIREILDFLHEYVETHFESEERLMRQHKYIGHDSHRQEHQRFTRQLREMEQEIFRYGPSPKMARILQQRLWGWFKDHIGRKDQYFGEFLREKGLTPDSNDRRRP
jgi:hemerythrin